MRQQISINKLLAYRHIKKRKLKCSVELSAEGLSKAFEILEVFSWLQAETKHFSGQRWSEAGGKAEWQRGRSLGGSGLRRVENESPLDWRNVVPV